MSSHKSSSSKKLGILLRLTRDVIGSVVLQLAAIVYGISNTLYEVAYALFTLSNIKTFARDLDAFFKGWICRYRFSGSKI